MSEIWTDTQSAALAAMILAGRSWDEVFAAHPDRDPAAVRRHAIDGCMALNLPGRWPQLPDDDDRPGVAAPLRPLADPQAAISPALARREADAADPLLCALKRQHGPGLHELKIRQGAARFVAHGRFGGSVTGSPLASVQGGRD